ncbi:MAG TPA: adenylate/guanylate cyclase domain-containing protein [Syntrophobacteraceae bacterium]|nr:adenylate/guanylate cyclase domain-containing protein [Syntrophobacteraceae bacterium]
MLKKNRLLIILLVVPIGTVILFLAQIGWLEYPEGIYYDLWHQLAGVRHHSQHTVIVAIDDQTLKEHADEPLVCWTPHFARAIAVLRQAGTRIIGLDYLYSVSMEAWLSRLIPDSPVSHSFDAPFKEQLASGQVVLAATLVADEQDQTRIKLPIAPYFSALPRSWLDVGLANFPTDTDGVVRHYHRTLTADDGHTLFTFAQLLALRAVGRDPAAELELVRATLSASDLSPATNPHLPRIGFVGPPGTIPRVSFGRLLQHSAATDPEILALHGKVAILAYEPSGVQDIHATPYTLGFWNFDGQYMSGPELHANIVETLLTGRTIRQVSPWLSWFYVVSMVFAGTMLFSRVSSWYGLAFGFVLGSLCALLAHLVFRHQWLIPTATPQLGLVLAYVGNLGIRLTGEERERTRLRHLFGRYVSDEVVEKLLASGSRPDLGGESQTVTVLFSDVRDFATISENLSPRQVVEMLNTYFSSVVETILAAGGTVDKFIGDAVMAVFGSPVRFPDHARRALLAALDMAAIAREFRTWMVEHHPGRELPEFRIGIGIHTGEVIVGSIGSPKRMEFTSIGDAVNIASRLENLSKELGWTIVASRAAVDAAGAGILLGRQAVRQVKGRQESVEVLEVTGFAVE